MNKKTIVLADNSYTIRRIVELSFSEEESIELISFEDGSNLKRKLLELKPEIVLVDIKLPEFSGYEVCRFINTTESLSHTKVFLLKGGFEPIDESLLTNLKYASIITKPFDSNALVATIKKMLAAPSRRTPATVPEETPQFTPGDLPDVDSFSEPESEIDFSGMDEENAPGNLLRAGAGQKTVQYLPSDDVLPSEEITQGTQPDFDSLAPTSADEMENPFQDESPISPARQKTLSEEEMDIKANIRMQERELDIESVTQEEMRLKKHLKDREEFFQSDRAILGDSKKPGKPGLLDDDKWGSPPPGLETEIEMPEIDEEKEMRGGGIGDIQTEAPGEELESAGDLQIDDMFEREKIIFEKEIKSQPGAQDSVSSPAAKAGFPHAKPKQGIQTPPPSGSEPGKKMPTQKAIKPEERIVFPDTPSSNEIEFEIPEIPSTPEVVTRAAPKKPAQAEMGRKERIEPRPAKEPIIPTKETPTLSEEEAPGIPSIQTEQLLYKVEDKLTLAIKEILWEVVPQMAEKIIKQEIDKLKTEVDKSFEYIEK